MWPVALTGPLSVYLWYLKHDFSSNPSLASNGHLVKRYSRALIAFALIVGTFLYYDAALLTLAKATAVAFWLAVLPGTLCVSYLLNKSLRSLETWVIGTAAGINLLPLGFLIGGFITSEASVIWWVIGIVISFFNLILISRVKARPKGESGQPLPFALLAIVGITFFAFYLSWHFSRNASSGNYTFSTYFGGDIPFLAAFITNFERTTILQDLHYGGARMFYHDFTLRLQAGLHFFAGGNIYDLEWYWFFAFDLVLMLSIVWLVVRRITESGIAAWAAAIGLFFFPGKLSELYVYDSSSFRIGLIESFFALYLIMELTTQTEKRLRHSAAALLVLVITALVGWKITDFVVLVPALFVVALLRGIREKKWDLMICTLIAGVLGSTYSLIVYSGANVITGQIVVGRPLIQYALVLNRLFGLSLHPVSLLSEITTSSFFSLLSLLIPLVIYSAVKSGRYFLTFAFLPWIPATKTRFPYFVLFMMSTMLVGRLFGVFFSKQFYQFGDVYPALFADGIGLIVLGIAVNEGWQLLRRQRRNGLRAIFTVGIIVLGLGIDFVNAAHSYHWLATLLRYDLPIRLVDELDSASTRVDSGSLVASHRFNLNRKYSNAPLQPDRDWRYVDWNFEFYAAGLKTKMIMEGPSDGLFGPAAASGVDSVSLVKPNPLYASSFWTKSRLLDSVYFSDANALSALDSLGATHVLIDHTIGQTLSPQLVAACDTAYSGLAITLLRRRTPH